MRYEEPSIIEALCEFRFRPDPGWDLTVFGRFSQAMQEQLPIREQAEVMSMSWTGASGQLRQEVKNEARMRFFAPGRDRLVQVGPDLLVVNVLRPYPHWETFRQFILSALDAYRKSTSDQAIERMTVRYIDRLDLPQTFNVLGEWIAKDSPYLPTVLRDCRHRAFNRVRTASDGGEEVVTLVLEPNSEGGPVFTLDTEIGRTMLGDESTLEADLDNMHARIIEVFEASISDRMRELLKPVA